ncbi:MAG: RHS repeat-associated core domain-containing protein [Candidatus Aminicenantes bacterium]|nr:RHS repeat-associated core domain-containing protein [Candidatus Aminicenantes bacterium]
MRTSNYYEGSETRHGGTASQPSEPLRGGPVMGACTTSYDSYSHSRRIDRSLPNSPNLERQEQKSAGRMPGKTLEASYTNTYYIWSFDGKLMAEYDHSGICVKEYIYFGNKLVAEYLPQENPPEGKYYYHLSDQVNSTRIVADADGSVVYSAAHGPFGDVQETWINTYDPKQKFSGKERETYSDLDYFGARYYDSHSYRFVSVDPIRNRDAAIANPQLWNLYTYCRNNPITFLDPNGLDNYVLYDARAGGGLFSQEGGFPNQAEAERKRLQTLNGEPSHKIGINTEEQFANAWNSMKDPNNVTLLFHSTGGPTASSAIYLGSKDQYLTTNPSGDITSLAVGTPIQSLSKKTMKTLSLYICHSGEGKNNVASTFADTQNIHLVVGVDGPFNYNPFSPTPKNSNILVCYITEPITVHTVHLE